MATSRCAKFEQRLPRNLGRKWCGAQVKPRASGSRSALITLTTCFSKMTGFGSSTEDNTALLERASIWHRSTASSFARAFGRENRRALGIPARTEISDAWRVADPNHLSKVVAICSQWISSPLSIGTCGHPRVYQQNHGRPWVITESEMKSVWVPCVGIRPCRLPQRLQVR